MEGFVEYWRGRGLRRGDQQSGKVLVCEVFVCIALVFREFMSSFHLYVQYFSFTLMLFSHIQRYVHPEYRSSLRVKRSVAAQRAFGLFLSFRWDGGNMSCCWNTQCLGLSFT
jgi:hypothetical protein